MMGFRSVVALLNFLLLFLSIVIIYLTFAHSDPLTPTTSLKVKYPPGIPNKFDADGNVQPFPGNTIICPLSNLTDLYGSLLILYGRLKQSHLSHLYVLLPPSSWHMTVFEGVVDTNRKRGHWPSDLATNATLKKCTAKFAKKLSKFDPQLKLTYRMSVEGLSPYGLGFHLEPDAEDSQALRQLRDRLADLLHIRSKNHDRYTWHLTLAYLLRYLTDEQKEEVSAIFMDHFSSMPKKFELGPPQFCAFDDMFTFKPLVYLKNKDG